LTRGLIKFVVEKAVFFTPPFVFIYLHFESMDYYYKLKTF